MMRPFSAVELERMKQTQEKAMQDICILQTYSETFDALHHPTPAWIDGTMLNCGLDPTGGQEIRDADKTVVRWDAMIRLPLNTPFSVKDRIKIIRRFGQTVTDQIIYEIDGPAEIGPSGMVVPLKKVDPTND